MNNIYSVPITTHNNNSRNTTLAEAQQLILDAALSSEKESKKKYATKAKLIENADDMSTREKLDALDKNYERRNLERCKNITTFVVIYLGVFSLIAGGPSVIKNVRKLIVA